MAGKSKKDQKPQEEPLAQQAQEVQAEQPEQTVQPEQQEQAQKTQEEVLQEQLDQTNDKLLRNIAEFDNFRKRTQKEKEAIYPQAVVDTVEKFLPVVDSFERALACACNDAEFKKGVEMIYTTFMETLQKLKVEEVGEAGEPFDPQFHNAVMHIEDDAQGENVVAQVLQKGYKIDGRVVRYAMVQVAN